MFRKNKKRTNKLMNDNKSTVKQLAIKKYIYFNDGKELHEILLRASRGQLL